MAGVAATDAQSLAAGLADGWLQQVETAVGAGLFQWFIHPVCRTFQTFEAPCNGGELGLPARLGVGATEHWQPPGPRRRRLPALRRPGREENPAVVLGVRRPGHLL